VTFIRDANNFVSSGTDDDDNRRTFNSGDNNWIGGKTTLL
jgi:hypothetical protein